MNLKKIRNILCIAVLLIAAAGTFVLFAYPRFVEPVVKYNEAQSLYESGLFACGDEVFRIRREA